MEMNGNENEFNDNGIFDAPNSRRRRIITVVVSMLVVIALALLTAFLLKAYVFTTFIVEGVSMNPTLDGGVYGDRYDGETLVLDRIAKLKRGDIVVFEVEGRTDSLVKRVIGVGGDTVTISDGKVYVNGNELSEPYAAGVTNPNDASSATYQVPDGYLFCLGDNREHSADSRLPSVGMVSLSKVNGKCVFILDRNGGIRFAK